MFEEQPSWHPAHNKIIDHFHKTIQLLEEVWKTKQSRFAPKPEKVEKVISPKIAAVQNQVQLAFNSVVSKDPTCFEKIQKCFGDTKGQYIKDFANQIREDVLKQYIDAGEEFDTVVIDKQVNAIVPKLLMRK